MESSLSTASALLQRTEGASDAASITAAMAVAWREIEAALAPIIGLRGVDALHKRSIYLAARMHPRLRTALQEGQSSVDLSLLQSTLIEQGPVQAAAGAGAILDNFHALLASLVGPALTEQLLHSVWANLLSGPPAQDSTP